MIYTSYFARLKKVRELCPSLLPVSVARKTPNSINIPSAPELFPQEEVLWKYKNGQIDEAKYKRMYVYGVLYKLDARQIAEKFENHVLLCYEKPDSFCHRHIIAAWLNYFGFPTEEIDFRKG